MPEEQDGHRQPPPDEDPAPPEPGEPTDPGDTPPPTDEARAEAAARESETATLTSIDWRSLHLWQIQPLRDSVFIAALVLLVLIGYWLSAITVPLLIALALAYLTEPIIKKAQQDWGWSRSRTVLLLLAVTGTLAAGALLIAVPLVVGQTLRLVSELPNYLQRFEDYLATHEYSPAIEEFVDTAQDMLAGRQQIEPGPVFTRAGEALQMVGQVLGSVIYLVFALFLIPFYYYFFALSYPKIVSFGRHMVPDANKDRVFDLVKKMDRAVAGFVRGRLVICVIMGFLFAIGWWLSGVPYWLLLGLLTGALSIVPYVSGLGLPLAVGLLYFKLAEAPGDEINYWRLIWPVVVYTIVQFLEGYVLIPLIQGKATNLDPVTILVAVLAGGTIMGFYGMILAIPIAACIKILLIEVVWPRFREWAEGSAEDPLPISRK
jgi:predicted PurR-regulated permease PerM